MRTRTAHSDRTAGLVYLVGLRLLAFSPGFRRSVLNQDVDESLQWTRRRDGGGDCAACRAVGPAVLVRNVDVRPGN